MTDMTRWLIVVAGLGAMVVGAILPVHFIVDRCLPSDYAEYAANYLKGLNLFRWLLMGGAVFLVLASRHVAGLLRTDPPNRTAQSNPVSLREWCEIAAVTIIGAVLCLIHYRQGFTFDEVFLVKAIITQNPIKMFVHPSGSAHVLNSLPANLLAHVFGPSEAICRLPALIASVLMPVALWAFARRLFSRGVALIAATIVIITPIHIWYAQEAKGNAWLMLLVPFSWYVLSRLAERWQCRLAIGYWLSLFLLSLSHLSGIMFILATIPVFLLPDGWRPCGLTREAGLRMVTLHLLAAWCALMFYAPIMPFMFDFSKVAHVNEGTAKLFPLLRDMLEQFTTLDQPVWSVLMGVLALTGLAVVWKKNRGLLVLFLLPFALDLVITIGGHLFSFPRYHMYVYPWLVLLIAATLTRLPHVALLLILAYLPALYGYYSQPKSNLKTLAAIIRQQPEQQIVYVVGGNQKSYPSSGLMYYTDKFETDQTVVARLEGMPDDATVELLVIDAMQFNTAYAPLAAFVNGKGTLVETFHCLAELDQFRVRESYRYHIKAGDLRQGMKHIHAPHSDL